MKNISRFGFSVPIVVFVVLSLTIISLIFSSRSQIDKKLGVVLEAQTPSEVVSSDTPSLSPTVSEKQEDPSLIKFNFTDLFSGTGWIDTGKTNLVHDSNATAFSFAPHISWEKVSPQDKNSINPNAPICIKNQCMKVVGENIFFNDSVLKLPLEIEKVGRILSVAQIDDRFLVFGTVQEGGVYKGYGFFFENGFFSPLCSESLIFSSPYKGEIGAGGNAENFLVVYGGYEGKGIQVIKNSCTDVSGYFGIRVMSGGFSPRIISSSGNWFIWSATPAIPRFLKVTSDLKTGIISGIFDLVPAMFPSGVTSAFFEIEKTDQKNVTLTGEITHPDERIELWRFVDRGFYTQDVSTIISKNINTNSAVKVRKARIINVFLSPGDTDPEFYLSNDGDEWSRATIGDEINFLNSSGRALFWMVVFRSSGEKTIPPFFGQINIEYKVKP